MKKPEYLIFIIFFSVAIHVAASSKVVDDSLSLQPSGYEQFENLTVSKGNIRTVFVDNSAYSPDHKKGYNGIAELYHSEQNNSAFVPDFSGLNLEHIFNGESPVSFFEPRKAPMELYRKSDSEILLYQKPTPHTKVESLMEFKMCEPDYIDFRFSCVLHDENFAEHDYAAFFFASYINQPPNLSMYFFGEENESKTDRSNRVIRAFTDIHGEKSTHKSVSDNHNLYFAPDFSITLANHFSDYRYSEPFFYGRFRNMVLAFLFEENDFVRFSQSPDGAGPGNPAWDFYYVIMNPEPGGKYSFNGRIVYKPFINAEDIKGEYLKWQNNRSRD